MKWVYAILCVLGLVLPYSFFVPFVLSNGPSVTLFFSQLFANPVSILFCRRRNASLALWVFIAQATRKRHIRLWWLCVLANLAVGVSLGLPLVLLRREMARDKERN
jgi:hypothetical protein